MHPEIWKKSNERNMKTQLKQILSKTRKETTSGKMMSSNSIQLFTLMLMVTMCGLNMCMANPVNKEDKLPIKLKERLFNVTSKESEDAMGKPESGATFIKEEESKKKASWETAKYIADSWSLFFCLNILNPLKRREKLYALIFSVVLGIFGADWFYLCVTRSIFNLDILVKHDNDNRDVGDDCFFGLRWLGRSWHDDENGDNQDDSKIIDSARPTSWLGWSSWSFAESEGFSVAALLAPVVAEISGTSRWMILS